MGAKLYAKQGLNRVRPDEFACSGPGEAAIQRGLELEAKVDDIQ